MISIGIDISQHHLDWTTGLQARIDRVSYDREGLASFVKQLRRLKPDRIVFAAAEDRDRRLMEALQKAGLPALRVAPERVHLFGEALGQLTKTDPVDARLLAHFGAVVSLPPTPALSPQQRERAALAKRHRQLTQMITVERRHLADDQPAVRDDVELTIRFLEGRVKEIEKRIDVLVQEDPHCRAIAERLRTVPGVGVAEARTLAADLPELGGLNQRQIAALVGLNPFAGGDGKDHSERRPRPGRAAPRAALYAAAQTAVHQDPGLRAFYQRLLDAGKSPELALVAVARKLLIKLNAMVRDETTWQAADG